MKLTYTLFILLLLSSATFSQDYFIKVDFINNKVKFDIPFNPDWSKDFFIETEVKVPVVSDSGLENAGLVFGYEKSDDSYYGLYIQNAPAQERKYKDYFKFRAKNVSAAENNAVWQETSLINHHAFNKLQIYKIANEAFFLINNQPIYHIKNIEAKGNELLLTTGKSGIYSKYVHAYYLDKNKSNNLKSLLLSQLENYNTTGIHHAIAADYKKIFDLKAPSELIDLPVTSYYPSLQAVHLTNGASYLDNLYFDKFSSKEIGLELCKGRSETPIIYNSGNFKVTIEQKGSPTVTLPNSAYVRMFNDSLALLIDYNFGFVSYDFITKKITKLIKGKFSQNGRILLSKNNKYITHWTKVYSTETGKEVPCKINNYPITSDMSIVACYDNKIIVKAPLFKYVCLDLVTKEEKVYSDGSIFYNGFYHQNYLFLHHGRLLDIYDLSTDKYVVQQLLILPNDHQTYQNYQFEYYPEYNEVYISESNNIKPVFYFSLKDEVVNTSAYIVNTVTNEITPFLFSETGATTKKNTEERQIVYEKSKIEVDNLLRTLKTFGSYYELNYDSFDYVNLSNNALLNKNGIGGTTYAIGKFCRFNGGDILALGITNDQYVVELLSVFYDINGININRKKLGVTQKVNGYATQVASVKVFRKSNDTSKFTLVVNDGRETKIELSNNCN